MQVSYKGFTGELEKLERTSTTINLTIAVLEDGVYAHISFAGVKPEDVKFIGGAVTFGK